MFKIEKKKSTGGRSPNQSIRRYMVVLTVVSFGMFLRFYDEKVNPCNSTVLAFSYKYGFIPQGLVGTLYQFINELVPFDMLNYETVMNFTLAAALLFHLLLFWFFRLCLKKCKKWYLQNLEYVILFCALLTISTFFSKRHFGRLDMYMLALSLACALLLIKGKAQWLAAPFSVLGMMVHQDFIFLYLNIVLVLLVYKALSAGGRVRRTCMALAAISLAAALALFFWFELFRPGNKTLIYDDIAAMAGKLSYKGEYDGDLIAREILGTNFAAWKWPRHVQNWVETPIFLLLISPYIVLGVKLMRGIIAQARGRAEKWKYRVVASGPITTLPLFLFKEDYGRWFFAVIIYYAVVVLALAAMGDEIVETQLFGLMARVRKKYSWSMLLPVYAVLFMPFWDVHICVLMRNIGDLINEAFLHVW